MDSIITQIRSLAEAADKAGRHSILDALQQLQSQLETPQDVLMKLYNSVSQKFVEARVAFAAALAQYTIDNLDPR